MALTPHNQAAKELQEGIPGLLEMDVLPGLAAIDEFVKTWRSPALSFNPWIWFQCCKHLQRHP